MSTSQRRNRLAVSEASRRWVAEQLEARRLLANSYALIIQGVTGELPLDSMELTTEYFTGTSQTGTVKFVTQGSTATPGLLYESAGGPQRTTIRVIGRNQFGAVFSTITFTSSTLRNIRAGAVASIGPGDHVDELTFSYRGIDWRYNVDEDPAKPQVVGNFSIVSGTQLVPDFGESGATATSAPLTLRDGNNRAMTLSSFEWGTEFRNPLDLTAVAPLNESALAIAVYTVARPALQPFRLNANSTFGANVVQYNEWTFENPIVTSATIQLAPGGETVSFGFMFSRVTQTYRTFSPTGTPTSTQTNSFNYAANSGTGTIQLPGTNSTTRYVLKLGGVTGDLPLDSFNWTAVRPGLAVQFEDLEAQLPHSLASPVLMQLAAAGTLFTSATIECRNATGLFATLSLGGVKFNQFHLSSTGDASSDAADFRMEFASFAWQFRRGANAANALVTGSINTSTQQANGSSTLNNIGYDPQQDLFALTNSQGLQGLAIDELDWSTERAGSALTTGGLIASGPMAEAAFALLYATAAGVEYASLRFIARRVILSGLGTYANLLVSNAVPKQQTLIFGAESIRQQVTFSPQAVDYTYTPYTAAGVAGTSVSATIDFESGTGSGSLVFPANTNAITGLFLGSGNRRIDVDAAEWSLQSGPVSSQTAGNLKVSAGISEASTGFLGSLASASTNALELTSRNLSGVYSQFSLSQVTVNEYRLNLARDGSTVLAFDSVRLGFSSLSWSYRPGENASATARTGSVNLGTAVVTVPTTAGDADYSPNDPLTFDYDSNTIGLLVESAIYDISRTSANSVSIAQMTVASRVSEASVALAFETLRGNAVAAFRLNERSRYGGSFAVDHELKLTTAKTTSFLIRLTDDESTQSFTIESDRFDSTWTPRDAAGTAGTAVTSWWNFVSRTGTQSLVFPVRSATIAGSIFDDANADGLLNGAETGIAGRTVFLDSNANRLYDAGEPIALTTTGGAYTIDLVPAGSYGLGLVLTGGVLVTTLLPAPLALAQGQSRSQSLGVAARSWFPSPGAGVTYSVVVNTLGLRGGNYSFTGDPASTTTDLNVLAVNGSTLTMQGTVRLGELSLATGTSATLNGTGASVLSVKSLQIATNSRLDLTRNNLIVDYATGNSPANAIRGYLSAGRAGGGWNSATGIVSTSVVSNPGTTVSYAEATAVLSPPTTFAGLPIDSSSLLVRYTREGDANLDRTTNFDDLLRLAASYNVVGGRVFSQGDFNYDGNVNFDDLLLLAASYNTSVTAVPPPAPLGAGPDDSNREGGSAHDVL